MYIRIYVASEVASRCNDVDAHGYMATIDCPECCLKTIKQSVAMATYMLLGFLKQQRDYNH